jgi:molecular chaperone GrpE
MTKKHRNEPLDPELNPPLSPGQGVSDEELQRLAQVAEVEVAAGSLAKEIESIAIALDQKTKEAAEANEKYLRTYADFENYRKRVQRDQADFRKYANEQMALELLTVIDHLSLAIKHANEAGSSGEGLQQGVEMVYKQFRDVLEKFGIVPFKAEGEPFDPAMHEAMMQVETGKVPENTVVQVFQDGYRYQEKVLRHAKVGVSKKPAANAVTVSATEDAQYNEEQTED